MKTRLIAAGLAVAVLLVVLFTSGTGANPCARIGDSGCLATKGPAPSFLDSPAPTFEPSVPGPTRRPSPSLFVIPTPAPTPPVYTFRDEFNGTTLNAAWGRHWPGFGSTLWSRSQVSVGNGVLTIKARRSGSIWISGLIDTVGTFTQKYGVFSARMKIVQGDGLWPAFWLAQPANAKHEQAEIDAMEVCANHVGAHDGNDVTLLHYYVHKTDGTHAFAFGLRTANLAQDWHVYTVDWQPDHITFFLDGVETTSFRSDTDISSVNMALVLDLAVGGRFCSESSVSTPPVPTLLVDWVRATR